MSNQLSLQTCKKRLAVVWTVIGLLLFFILVLQSVLGKFGDTVEKAWAWFLPTIMPTLSLIIGVLVVELKATDNEAKTVDSFLFRLAFGLSLVYLFAVALTIFIQPFTGLSPLTLMERSNLWLGPLQGLTSAALGAFFVKAAK